MNKSANTKNTTNVHKSVFKRRSALSRLRERGGSTLRSGISGFGMTFDLN